MWLRRLYTAPAAFVSMLWHRLLDARQRREPNGVMISKLMRSDCIATIETSADIPNRGQSLESGYPSLEIFCHKVVEKWRPLSIGLHCCTSLVR
ncbi:hypothetical protein EV361DRAFT_250727 [Lentinula raphanica]|nr:hypothetical protein EV361DRAFT_250727 [Lentinula raphanica]